MSAIEQFQGWNAIRQWHESAPPEGSAAEAEGGATFYGRKAHVVWSHVDVKGATSANNYYQVSCKRCNWGRSKPMVANTNKLEAHFQGINKASKCGNPPDVVSDALRYESNARFAKHRRIEAFDMNTANETAQDDQQQQSSSLGTTSSVTGSLGTVSRQGRDIRNYLAPATKEEVDRAIADFWYGDIIPFNVAASPRWIKLVKALKSAPHDYVAPTPWRLRYPILDARHTELQQAVAFEADYLKGVGVTFTSDGWEDVESAHMINFLYVSPRGSVFVGTEDGSDLPSLDAKTTADLMIAKLRLVGAKNVVTVVMDTCSTMQAMWRLVDAEFPHITCACCGPHVLNLLIKDICKSEPVADVIGDIEYVSKWFTNKKWKGITLRKRLLKAQAIAQFKQNLKCKKVCGTRFASVIMVAERLLKLKCALQSTVVHTEWRNAKFQQEIEDDVSDKILDKDWWARLESLVNLLLPIKKVLRVLDTNKPTISKIYDIMFKLGERIRNSEFEWKEGAIKCFDERWIYIHSPIHAAGYALDPEYLNTTGSPVTSIQTDCTNRCFCR